MKLKKEANLKVRTLSLDVDIFDPCRIFLAGFEAFVKERLIGEYLLCFGFCAVDRE